jgi:hypothetical protein
LTSFPVGNVFFWRTSALVADPEDLLKVDEDEEGVGGDDAEDWPRYLVTTKSRTVAQRKPRGL